VSTGCATAQRSLPKLWMPRPRPGLGWGAEALRDPGQGIGKPERLTENLSGYWSRRITDEHRLVHTVRGENLVVVQARYHY
jgi:hypothetical protein